MVNELLKEMLSYASPKSMWRIDIDCTDNNGDPDVNSEWTLVTSKNHLVKSKKWHKWNGENRPTYQDHKPLHSTN
jgi:hypothetical protein